MLNPCQCMLMPSDTNGQSGGMLLYNVTCTWSAREPCP